MTRDSSQASEDSTTDRGDSHVVSARRIGSEGLEVASGRSHRIEVVPMGTIHVRLMDWAAQEPVPNMAYTILNVDGQHLTGETDDDGLLRHDDVTAGYYVLEVEDQWATVFTVPDPDEPEIVRLVLRDPPDSENENDRQLGVDEDVAGEGTGTGTDTSTGTGMDGLGAGGTETSPWRA